MSIMHYNVLGTYILFIIMPIVEGNYKYNISVLKSL